MSSILLIRSDPAAGRATHDALCADPSLTVRDGVATLAEARARIAARVPDLLIADLQLPDGRFADLLVELAPDRSRTLVITPTLHHPHLMHALRSGADGFIVAGRPTEALLRVVRRTLAGESPIAPEIARQVLAHFDGHDARPIAAGGSDRPTRDALSEADRHLLICTSQGHQLDEIARALGVRTREVGLRVRALYARMRFARPAAAAQPVVVPVRRVA